MTNEEIDKIQADRDKEWTDVISIHLPDADSYDTIEQVVEALVAQLKNNFKNELKGPQFGMRVLGG